MTLSMTTKKIPRTYIYQAASATRRGASQPPRSIKLSRSSKQILTVFRPSTKMWLKSPTAPSLAGGNACKRSAYGQSFQQAVILRSPKPSTSSMSYRRMIVPRRASLASQMARIPTWQVIVLKKDPLMCPTTNLPSLKNIWNRCQILYMKIGLRSTRVPWT